MTPLTKRRWSTRRQGIRRASIKLTLPTLIECKKCHELILPHRACKFCGSYKDKK
ncbi:MAG: 50S ribosomal protein L32 [Candidatus Amesbacteria bacterium]|nr:50S ribosomal protein L32 [Candidatus Amesbacteria bacterium]MDP1743823.1 50S ribosomal protein L32 [Candidatus Amesbacteria bacterium]